MIPKHIQKLVDEGKMKIASHQENLNSSAQLVLSGIANQISDGNVRVLDIFCDSMGDDKNDCFIFTTFKLLK